MTCTDDDKPNKLGRGFQVECDDLTDLADYLMQYVDDPRFGAEMIALRKIALGARVHEQTVALRKIAHRRAEKAGHPKVEQAIDLGQGDPRRHALTRLQEAVEDAIAEVPSTAALLDESLANLRNAIDMAKSVDADIYCIADAQDVLWSIEHTISYKKFFDVHVKDELEGTAQVSSSMELDLLGEDGKRL